MEVPIFLLADYANTEAGGKLNMLGVFNEIRSIKFPAVHRMLYLVSRLKATIGEFDEDHTIRILFIDEDGQEINEFPGKINIKRPESGTDAFADLIIQINDLKLDKPGNYEFRLVIDKDVKGILPLDVKKVDVPNAE